MAVFSLQEVKKLQVQNVIDDNFASWPESANYGYCGTGYGPVVVTNSSIFRLDLLNGTVSNPGSGLPTGGTKLASVSSAQYGYLTGGNFNAGSYSVNIFRYDVSSEVVSDTGNDLPVGVVGHKGTESESYGYFGGGQSYPPITVFSTILRLDFASGSVSSPGKNMPAVTYNHATIKNNKYGYFLGGQYINAGFSYGRCLISRLDFSSETLNLPGTNIPILLWDQTATQSLSHGYLLGGRTPASTDTIRKLDFDSESISTISSTLPATRARSSEGVENSIYGYMCGAGEPTYICTITRLDFTTESVSDPGIGLPASIRDAIGFSGGASVARGNGYKTYGYYGGGYKPPVSYESRIERIEFSTETDSIMPSRLIYQHSLCNTVSSNNHGYFVGGFVPNPTHPNATSKVQRFDFISEIVSEIPSQAPYEISSSGTLSNAQYGYIGGGLKGSPSGGFWTCNVVRLDFSSDSMSQPSSNLTESRSVLNGVSDLRNNLGYFGGGYTSCRVCRIDLSSETITQNPSPLDKDMSQSRSYQSGDYGYWAGGKYTPNQPPPGARASGSTRKVQFSTGTTQVGSPMWTGRYAGGVSQDNYYAWYAAGTAPGFGVRTSNVQRVELSTETYSNPGNPLAINRDTTIGGLSN